MTTYAHDISPDVLAGGEWVCVRGVMRWVAQPAPTLTLVPEPEPELDSAGFIACPTCRATIAESCKSRTGLYRYYPHPDRLVPRRCACGNALPPRKTYCRFCRADRRAESRARYESKRRAS